MVPIVIVTGSRKWKDRRKIRTMLDVHDPSLVVHGGAAGADTLAQQWCKNRGRYSLACYPDWDNVKGAALVRNRQMLEQYPTAVVLAFPFPDSRGTRYTIKIAKQMGMRVVVIEGTPVG